MQDLEFASVIVQKLNIILITSPELADFRKRLKSLETRVSSPPLHAFYVLKLSGNSKTGRRFSPHYIAPGVTMQWPSFPFAFLRKHTSTRPIYFPFCTSDQYSKATLWFITRHSADLEITVQMLVQVDKLVQLIESPVFTCKSTLLLSRFWLTFFQIFDYSCWNLSDIHTYSSASMGF